MWQQTLVSWMRTPSPHLCSSRRGRVCSLERLEERSLLAVGGIEGLGVLGDSLSDEYAHELHFYARNWVELLAEEKDVPFGEIQDWGEPRREGQEELVQRARERAGLEPAVARHQNARRESEGSRRQPPSRPRVAGRLKDAIV